MSVTDTKSVPPSRTKIALAVLAFVLCYLPFVAKPIHIDDANFLMLAEGAAQDPWRPHNILINWSGVTQPAFDILANPPGIAWYLAPVRRAPEWVLHLWMLPWLALGAWGCRRLGRELVDGDGFVAAIYLLTCPVVVIAAQALTPDLPLFACMTAGIGGFLTARVRWPFALLAGCAALFRYSGGTAIPLVLLIGWRRGGWRGASVAMLSAVPIALLAFHDLLAYEKIHLVAMFFDQNDPVHKPFSSAVHNTIAGVAMLGGAAVLPVLIWQKSAVLGAILGASAGLSAAYLSGQRLEHAILTAVFTASGAAALALALAPRVRHPLLSCWALGGAAFFFVVRFAAVRYWAAFAPGVGLLALRNARGRSWLLGLGIAVNVLVSLGIAIDDYAFARALKDGAARVALEGPGSFSGHWGWQHYLEAADWVPIERDGETSAIHAYPAGADPQLPAKSVCLELVERFRMPDHWWGPRVHAPYGGASYHAGGRGQYSPWTLSDEPYDVISVYRRCDAGRDTTSEPGEEGSP